MSFWKQVEERPQDKKLNYIIAKDLVDLLDKETDLSVTKPKQLRFLGSFFGVNTINVPLIKENRFVRKKDTSRLVAIPKICLGYDYLSNTLDESKCPYLQHANINNPSLLLATIDYVETSDMKDKELLVQRLRSHGLRYAWFEDQTTKGLIKASRELSDHLQTILKNGNRDYYSNVLIHPVQPNQEAMYTDFTYRSPSETIPTDFLDYTSSYGEKVYLKDKASKAVTPVKVMKLSANVLETGLYPVVQLNKVINAEGVEEIKGLEDPEYGATVYTQLKPTALKSFQGKTTFSYAFQRGERNRLTENEKKYLLWDLRVLQGNETYDQALKFLSEVGYIQDKGTKTISFGDNVASAPANFMAQMASIAAPLPAMNQVAQPVMPQVAPAIQPVVQPAVAPVVQPVIQPVAQPVLQQAPVMQQPAASAAVSTADDFDSMFEG